MSKRGRRSAAEAEIENVVDFQKVRETMLIPSDKAAPEIRQIFAQIVTSAPTDHFKRIDCHLIEAYAQAIWTSQKAFAEMQRHGLCPVSVKGACDAVKVHDTAIKQMMSLATKLRLTPQATTEPKTAGRNRRDKSDQPHPWETAS